LPVKEVPKINHVTDFQEKDNSTTNTTKRAWNTVPQSTIIAATGKENNLVYIVNTGITPCF